MRSLSRNKQIVYYSRLGTPEPIYERDEDGNIVYETLRDGTQVPVETGEQTNGYSVPEKFYGNIAAAGGASEAAKYGVDLASYEALLYVRKGMLELSEKDLLWYQHEPSYLDDGQVDPNSADYKVARVPPVLDELVYLLEGVV